MGECFFWYRPTRAVPNQRPLNDCVCVCVNDDRHRRWVDLTRMKSRRTPLGASGVTIMYGGRLTTTPSRRWTLSLPDSAAILRAAERNSRRSVSDASWWRTPTDTGTIAAGARPGWTSRPLHASLIAPATIRYDTRCYFNVRSKADMSQLNLPHGTDN